MQKRQSNSFLLFAFENAIEGHTEDLGVWCNEQKSEFSRKSKYHVYTLLPTCKDVFDVRCLLKKLRRHRSNTSLAVNKKISSTRVNTRVIPPYQKHQEIFFITCQIVIFLNIYSSCLYNWCYPRNTVVKYKNKKIYRNGLGVLFHSSLIFLLVKKEIRVLSLDGNVNIKSFYCICVSVYKVYT